MASCGREGQRCGSGPGRAPGRYAIWAALYAAFIVYGSLIPFEYRDTTLAAAWEEFGRIPRLRLGIGSRADWVANILLYVPLAFLLAGAAAGRCRTAACRSLVYGGIFALCAALAAGVEFAQLFFPQRTVSLNDIQAELVGSGLGIALWHWTGGRLEWVRRTLAAHGAQTPRILVLLYGIGYGLLSLFPFDFLVSGPELAWKLNSGSWGLWQARNGCVQGLSCLWQRLAEILAALPLGVGLALWRPLRFQGGLGGAARWGLGLGVVLEAVQFLTASNISQGVSVVCRGLGVVLGYEAGRSARRSWWASGLRTLARPGVLLPAGLGYAGLAARLVLAGKGPWLAGPEVAQRLARLHFTPFYYHYFTSETRAVDSFLVYFCLYAPLGLLVFARVAAGRAAWNGFLASAGLGALASLALESAKLWLARTHPDPTNLLIGAFGALSGYWASRQLHLALTAPGPSAGSAAGGELPPGQGGRPVRLRTALAAVSVITGAWLFTALLAEPAGPIETAADERFHPRLPEPGELPAARLPGFKAVHPRLPVPSEAELAKLRAENPDFLKRTAGLARGGAGPFDAVVFTAYARSDDIDPNLLFRRLMELRFTDRGDAQAKSLALAYDWLYGRWTPEQRAALLEKNLAACRYEIDFIRKARLSPYNVILYNSPLQGLVACAIAVYGDSPEAAPIMNFTHDLWKNRVLPVWRQVMGRNGGWHEGGEYVGIGIGQAVYTVPALWRAATGEDLFRSEPGLKGFLDFLVYRTRPDGTYLRLGDAGYFDRAAPDRIPLAIEYGHPAAYALNGCPRPDEPSAWPWGPLTRQGLCVPRAVSALPPQRLFDGLGLVIARSGWDEGATLASFKAGDNFWSHSHLDQGSFTIYKGGALAIDSGLYGTGYGSDHHLNYAYQTVAHNAVTVTDPADIAPMPMARQARPIANDGGQRRVGSGWGQEPAPLDRAEWERKREIYHTGTLLGFFEARDLVVAVADLTPAYTHRSSRKGSFFSRTRRVESLVRTFLYDRINDVVIVHDRVRATDPGFVKRSLVHSLEQPVRTGFGFRVRTPAEPVPGKSGGILDVHVLWPEDAHVDFVGGTGAEFWVDGRNYDDGGRVWRVLAQRPLAEPGRWRTEIKPREPALRDDFLMVLQPRLADRPEPRLRVRKLAGGPGCEIEGPGRTLSISFPGNSSLPALSLDGQVLDWRRYRVHRAGQGDPGGGG